MLLPLVGEPHPENHHGSSLVPGETGRMQDLTTGELLKIQVPGPNPRGVQAAGPQEAWNPGRDTHGLSLNLAMLLLTCHLSSKKG